MDEALFRLLAKLVQETPDSILFKIIAADPQLNRLIQTVYSDTEDAFRIKGDLDHLISCLYENRFDA